MPLYKKILLVGVLTVVCGLSLCPEPTFAQGKPSLPTRIGRFTPLPPDIGDLGGSLCKVVIAMKGNIGKAVASIAIIFLGIGTFFGRVEWGTAVKVGVGISAIFGAVTITMSFGGNPCGYSGGGNNIWSGNMQNQY